MADDKGIIRRVVALFDRTAGKKMERDFEESLKSAGEQGGKAAGVATMTEIKREFDRRKAELGKQLAEGVIDKKEWRKQTDLAAKTFNDGVLKLMDQAKAKGKEGDAEFVRLSKSIKRVGDDGRTHIGGGLVGALKTAAFAAGAVFALDRVRRFGQASVQAFEELRTGTRQLEQQLANTGIAWADVSDEVRAHARALWDTHRLTDGEVQGTLRQLVLVTGDYAKSLSLVGLAHDLMAATGLGAEQATRLLGRAMNGETGALNRYGIQLQDNRDVVEQLTERLNGNAKAATSNADTWAKAMGDLRETIGGLITAAFGMDEGFSAAAGAVRKLNDALSENAEEWGRVGRFTVGVTKTIGHAVWIVAQAVGSGISGIIGGVLTAINLLPKSVNAVIGQLNRLPGVDIGVRLGELPADRFLDEMRAANERTKDSVSGIADAWRDVGTEAGRASRSGTISTSRGGGTGGGATAGRPRDIERELQSEIAALKQGAALRTLTNADIERAWELQREVRKEIDAGNASLERRNELARRSADLFGVIASDRPGAGLAAIPKLGLAGLPKEVKRISEESAEAFKSPWADATDAIKEEFGSLEESALSMFHALATGGIGSIARLAKGKIAENLAWAAENFAKSMGWIALGNMPSATAAKAAAGMHLKTAGMWAAAGGASGAFSGGDKKAGGAPGAAAPNTAIAQRSERPGTEVHLYIDPLDPLNPAAQRFVYGAQRYATERYGENARIIMHRRSG